MNRIVPVVIAVLHDKQTGKYLLVQRNEIDSEDKEYGHCWNFPGGGLQYGETLEKGLAREIREELGVEIEIKKLIPRIFTPVRHRWQGILMSFLCEFRQPGAKIKLNHESLAYGWYTLDEIKSLRTLPLAYEIAVEASKEL